MMVYDRVYNQLLKIEKLSGPKAKAPLLAEYLKDEDFKRIVKLMLDPFITFGVNSFPMPEKIHEQKGCTDQEFYKIMDELQRRVVTGHAARQGLSAMVYWGVPADLLDRILNKSPRAGFEAGPVNKICPGLIPEFSYMRCSLPKQVKTAISWHKGWIAQLKSDGMFINLNREVDHVEMLTRQGNPLPVDKFPRVSEAAMALNVGTQTHGELVVYKAGQLLPREQGNGLINSIIQGNSLAEDEQVFFQVWDQIPITSAVKKGKYKVPYIERLTALFKQLPSDLGYVQVIEHRIVFSKADSVAYFKEVLLRGLEGTVDKHPEMFWEDGTSKGQIKNKGTFAADLRIKGYREGKGKFAGMVGSILGETSDGLLEVAVSGMSDKLRTEITKNKDKYLGTIMNVLYNAITVPSPSNDKHSFFLPRLNDLCIDRTKADSLERVKEEYDNVIAAM